MKGKIYKSQERAKYSSRADEIINHIVSECLKLSQKEYKKRDDWMERQIHWEICGGNGIHVRPK